MSNFYKVPIDQRLLNKWVFGQTEQLILVGTLESIHGDVFKGLPELNNFVLELYNMREFFHSSDNSWLAGLGLLRPNYSTLIQELRSADRPAVYEDFYRFTIIDHQGKYEYPEEDLCLFKYYPLEKPILVVFESLTLQGAPIPLDMSSCLLVYLLRTNFLLYLNIETVRKWSYMVANQGLDANCDLEKRFKRLLS